MLRVFLLALLALTFSTLYVGSAKAGESQFGFIYTTDLLPKGEKEIEQWLTWRNSKIGSNFNLLEGKTAIEYGISDNFQGALYATYDWMSAYHNGPFGATTPAEQFSYDNPGPDDHYTATKFIGISAEQIWRIFSPYTDPVGFAVYVEPTIGDKFVELELKLILQKNYLDDTLTLAFNFTYAPEFRQLYPGATENGEWNQETDVNYDLGISYRFVPKWWVGFEALDEQERNSLNFNRMTNDGIYLGPNIHYGGKDYFVTATFVSQMPWAGDHVETVPGAVVDHKDFDNDFEKNRLRFKAGWYF